MLRRLAMGIGLLTALAAVTALRFNQRDVGLIGEFTGTGVNGNLGDAAAYIRYVEAIRGEIESLPPAPFRYRPLTPLLAAPLPLSAMTAINVVNVVALALGALGTWLTLHRLGCSDLQASMGSGLFIVSFPTLYYGSIGYVDPLAIALMALILAALVHERYAVALLLVPLAALARESTVIIVAAAVVWLWAAGEQPRSTVKWALLWACTFAGFVAAIRVGLAGDGTNVWKPSVDVLVANARRPRTWISAGLTLGVPFVMILVFASHLRAIGSRRLVFFAFGFVSCGALFGYSLVAAYADGRFLWPIYVFSVPLAVLLLVESETSGQRSDLDKGEPTSPATECTTCR